MVVARREALQPGQARCPAKRPGDANHGRGRIPARSARLAAADTLASPSAVDAIGPCAPTTLYNPRVRRSPLSLPTTTMDVKHEPAGLDLKALEEQPAPPQAPTPRRKRSWVTLCFAAYVAVRLAMDEYLDYTRSVVDEKSQWAYGALDAHREAITAEKIEKLYLCVIVALISKLLGNSLPRFQVCSRCC